MSTLTGPAPPLLSFSTPIQLSNLLSRRRAVASLFALPALATAQNQNPRLNYPPVLEGARAELFKTIGEVQLKLWIFTPDAHRDSDNRAAIIFFFGGGWTSGSPEQ